MQFEIADLLGGIAFHKGMDISVPGVSDGELGLSDIVPFVAARTVPGNADHFEPFAGAGVKFVPRAGAGLELIQGEPLRFFYQVWAPIAKGAAKSYRSLNIEYVYGRLGAQDTKTIPDQLPLNQLDQGGSIINGKQILTADLPPGNYRLVMTLRDPESQSKSFRSINFSVVTAGGLVPAWNITEAAPAPGEMAWQRALCYSTQDKKQEALEWFRSAYTQDPLNERFRDKLIDLYFDRKDYGNVVQLYSRGGLRESTDEQTIVRLAESFLQLGDQAKAVAVMESGVTLNPKSATLQLGLADYYRRIGQAEKATAAEKRAKQLMASPTS